MERIFLYRSICIKYTLLILNKFSTKIIRYGCSVIEIRANILYQFFSFFSFFTKHSINMRIKILLEALKFKKSSYNKCSIESFLK